MSMMKSVRWAVLAMAVAWMGMPAQESLTTATAMARVAKKVTPEFPTAAKQLNVSGTQEVQVTVGPEGDVVEAKVLKGNAIFSNASLSAVKQWKFTPLTKDGEPVRFTAVLMFNYQK